MSGFCLLLCVVACVSVLAGVAAYNLWRGQARAVLIISPGISVRITEGAARAAFSRLVSEYAVVAAYSGALEGERFEILRRLCGEYNVELLERRAALRLWRGRGVDFWRLGRDGGMVRVR